MSDTFDLGFEHEDQSVLEAAGRVGVDGSDSEPLFGVGANLPGGELEAPQQPTGTQTGAQLPGGTLHAPQQPTGTQTGATLPGGALVSPQQPA